jgi:hypothetical protein
MDGPSQDALRKTCLRLSIGMVSQRDCLMAKAARERISLDLRGLAPALRAHARARHLTVSQAARIAVAAVLEPPEGAAGVQIDAEAAPAPDQLVKLTIRLRSNVASQFAARARASGLSQGAYLTTLIHGMPAPSPLVVKTLAASTEQLAILSGDMNEVIRRLRTEALSASEELEHVVRGIVADTREHLELACRVVAEFRPARTNSTPHPRRQAVRRHAES